MNRHHVGLPSFYRLVSVVRDVGQTAQSAGVDPFRGNFFGNFL